MRTSFTLSTIHNPTLRQLASVDEAARSRFSTSAEAVRSNQHAGTAIHLIDDDAPPLCGWPLAPPDWAELGPLALPVQVRANGGVFLIDDFGRQLVSPRELLNRWIVPLEERIDYLTLGTGRKLTVPFEQFIVFSTNLDPKDLVDDAFLRRIRHKMRIDPPDREAYSLIFELACDMKGVPYSEEIVELLFQKHYTGPRLPRSSDPRDLLEIVSSLCRFHDQPMELTESLVETAARQFFAQL